MAEDGRGYRSANAAHFLQGRAGSYSGSYSGSYVYLRAADGSWQPGSLSGRGSCPTSAVAGSVAGEDEHALPRRCSTFHAPTARATAD